MQKVKQFLAVLGGDRPKERELRELRNRVSFLEIQGGRIKEERDQARAHLKRIRESIAIMT
ncbi:hypothetical protein ADL19_14955 [Streptomyces purpurogeneiscleroticus]|nr:hypothetical protein ADL19_14955 [Streptomyces purpurogeneiscleroticus]